MQIHYDENDVNETNTKFNNKLDNNDT